MTCIPVSRRSFSLGMAAASGVAAWTGIRPCAHASQDGLLEQVQSPYNDVRIVQRGTVRTMYFVVDGVAYIESRHDHARPASLDLDYTRTMMAGFLIQPAVKRLLMLGFGGGQMSNYLFERFSGIDIDGVDIDPEVVRLARKYFGVPKHPRYRTHVMDARLFLERSDNDTRWDMIMLDAFRGVFVPYHLKTQEFYRACLARLSHDGVVVANLHNATRMYPHDRQTLAIVFPNEYAFVSESGNQTTFVGSASTRKLGAYAIRANATVSQPHFDFDLFGLAARYYLRRDWELDAELLRDDFKPAQLEQATHRHNITCIRGCRYQTH